MESLEEMKGNGRGRDDGRRRAEDTEKGYSLDDVSAGLWQWQGSSWWLRVGGAEVNSRQRGEDWRGVRQQLEEEEAE